jgi:hypothetical protein
MAVRLLGSKIKNIAQNTSKTPDKSAQNHPISVAQ